MLVSVSLGIIDKTLSLSFQIYSVVVGLLG